jgi:hypothetical protein
MGMVVGGFVNDDRYIREVEELKASTLAVYLSIKGMLQSYIPPDHVGDFIKTYDQVFIDCLKQIRGVDLKTNLNIGKVHITKYNKEEMVEQWIEEEDNAPAKG